MIAAVSSIVISRKETKNEIAKLIKQHEFDMENEKEKHKNELEKQEIEHRHQMELLQKENEGKMNSEMMSVVLSEAMKNPEVQRQIAKGISKSNNKKH